MLLTTDDRKLITPSPALREPAHVTLGAALGERELRAAVGAGADEVLPFPGALAHHPVRPGAAYPPRRDRPTQRIRLHPLIFLHPLPDRHPDVVAHRQHLVPPQ